MSEVIKPARKVRSLEEALLREDLEFMLVGENGIEVREYENGTREIIAKGRSLFVERRRREGER